MLLFRHTNFYCARGDMNEMIYLSLISKKSNSPIKCWIDIARWWTSSTKPVAIFDWINNNDQRWSQRQQIQLSLQPAGNLRKSDIKDINLQQIYKSRCWKWVLIQLSKMTNCFCFVLFCRISVCVTTTTTTIQRSSVCQESHRNPIPIPPRSNFRSNNPAEYRRLKLLVEGVMK